MCTRARVCVLTMNRCTAKLDPQPLENKEQEPPSTVVFKASHKSLNMKQGREALFCDADSSLRKALACVCADGSVPFPSPKMYCALGNWGGDPQGVYLLMEDVRGSSTRADQYHGAQAGTQKLSGDGGEVESKGEPKLKSQDMWQLSFEYAADTHARYWGRLVRENKKLVDGIGRLKYADWIMGKNKQGYDNSIRDCLRIWNLVEKDWMSSRIKSVITNSLKTADFAKAVAEMRNRPTTLVHGDFHAKNLFYMSKTKQVSAVDFSEIGVGDPISDLTQYVLSDISTSTRRKHEQSILKAYWNRLTTVDSKLGGGKGAISLSFQQFMELYKSGIDRWVWFFPFMAYFDGCSKKSKRDADEKKTHWSPPERTVYFHDSINAFLEDHCSNVERFVMRGVCEIFGDAFIPKDEE